MALDLDRSLSILEISEISAATGIGNILKTRLTTENDIVLTLSMQNDEMISIRNLSRIANFFGISQEDVILTSCFDGLEVSVHMSKSETKQVCCGSGRCVGCPSGR